MTVITNSRVLLSKETSNTIGNDNHKMCQLCNYKILHLILKYYEDLLWYFVNKSDNY